MRARQGLVEIAVGEAPRDGDAERHVLGRTSRHDGVDRHLVRHDRPVGGRHGEDFPIPFAHVVLRSAARKRQVILHFLVRRRDDREPVGHLVDPVELLDALEGSGEDDVVVPGAAGGTGDPVNFRLLDLGGQSRHDLVVEDKAGLVLLRGRVVRRERARIGCGPNDRNAAVVARGLDLRDEGLRAHDHGGDADHLGGQSVARLLHRADAAAAVAGNHGIHAAFDEPLLELLRLRARVDGVVGAAFADFLHEVDVAAELLDQHVPNDRMGDRSREAAANQCDRLAPQGVKPRRLRDHLHRGACRDGRDDLELVLDRFKASVRRTCDRTEDCKGRTQMCFY